MNLQKQKQRSAEEKRYEKYIKSLPCVHCRSEPCTWHHAIGYGNGGFGMKAHWLMTMPMCGKCHAEFHADIKNGVDGCVKAQLKYLEDTLFKAFVDGVIVIK